MLAFLKSTGFSLVAHAIAVLGLFVWPTPSTDQFTLSGQRDVISLEASQSSSSSSLVMEVESNVKEEPLEPEYEPVSALPVERQIDITRVSRVEPAPARPMEVKLETPSTLSEVSLVSPRVDMRQAAAEVELPDPKDEPTKPPRRRAPSSSPATSLPVAEPMDQLVGLKENAAPDFSGNPPPAYPAEAVQQRLEGVVLLRLFVSATGSIEKVEIAESSGHAILDNAAASAVRKWKGQPARSGYRAVATVEVLPIRFRL